MTSFQSFYILWKIDDKYDVEIDLNNSQHFYISTPRYKLKRLKWRH